MDTQPDKDPLGGFKESVRKWLRNNQLSIEWLAKQIDRSEGTVRNWIYTSIPIPPNKQDAIRQIIQNFVKHQVIPEAALCFLAIDVDKTPPEFNCWTTAWGVTESFFSPEELSSGNTAVNDIASVITNIVKDAVVTSLTSFYNKIKEELTPEADIHTAIQESLKKAKYEGKIEFLTTPTTLEQGSNPEKSNRIFLPFLPSEWKEMQPDLAKAIEIAAAIAGKNPTEWVINTLNNSSCAACVEIFDAIEKFITLEQQNKENQSADSSV